MEENTVVTEEMENTTPETTYDESYEDSGSGFSGVLLGSALTVAVFGAVKAGKWAWGKIKNRKKKDDSKEKSEGSESEETETSETEKKK